MSSASSPPLHQDHRHLRDLDAEECWALVSTQPVGRLVWQGADGPSIVPVNFISEGEVLHVRTAAYSELARECDDSPVTFEVDSFDPADRSGWSVIMRGHARLTYDNAAGPAPSVWPDGSRALHLEVPVHTVSGRRVG